MRVGVYVVTIGTEDSAIAEALCRLYSFADYTGRQEYDVVLIIDYHSGTMDELTAKFTVESASRIVMIKSDAVTRYSRENDDEYHLQNLSSVEKDNLINGDPTVLLEIPFLKEDMEIRIPKN